MFANRNFFSRLGFIEEYEVVGKVDFELFPKPLAEKFRRDDESVLATGTPMPQMVELFLSRQGLPDWFVTNKVPVLDASGKPAGVMGTVQRYDHSSGLASGDAVIARAVKLLLDRPDGIRSLAELAESLGIAYRSFDRRFKQQTGLTPKQFLGRSRIQLACERLRDTPDSIAEIAIDLGFCDQSALTSQFRNRMGLTPLRYRRQFGR
ncbi:MAG: helix-turn-helix domain-containing protein [Verrucomicrobiales bacterium]|nr:helix-turn-helix domain-containing protein [Verrucomicrobiales bacterium]